MQDEELAVSSDSDQIISDELAEEILTSPEYKTILALRAEVFEKTVAAIKSGVSKEAFANALIKDLEFLESKPAAQSKSSLEDQPLSFVSVLLTDEEVGAKWQLDFMERMEVAQNNLVHKYPVYGEVLEVVSGSGSCNPPPAEKVGLFVDWVYSVVDDSDSPSVLDEGWEWHDYVFPACGSAWKRIKAAACAAVCSAGGAFTPPAVIACLWGCWCAFCDHDASPLAEWMC